MKKKLFFKDVPVSALLDISPDSNYKQTAINRQFNMYETGTSREQYVIPEEEYSINMMDRFPEYLIEFFKETVIASVFDKTLPEIDSLPGKPSYNMSILFPRDKAYSKFKLDKINNHSATADIIFFKDKERSETIRADVKDMDEEFTLNFATTEVRGGKAYADFTVLTTSPNEVKHTYPLGFQAQSNAVINSNLKEMHRDIFEEMNTITNLPDVCFYRHSELDRYFEKHYVMCRDVNLVRKLSVLQGIQNTADYAALEKAEKERQLRLKEDNLNKHQADSISLNIITKIFGEIEGQLPLSLPQMLIRKGVEKEYPTETSTNMYRVNVDSIIGMLGSIGIVGGAEPNTYIKMKDRDGIVVRDYLSVEEIQAELVDPLIEIIDGGIV